MGGGSRDVQHPDLFDASRRGDTDKLNAWLNNRRNRRLRTPLNFLRSSTTTSSTTNWLSSIRDPSTGYTCLHLAALHGHTSIVTTLIAADQSLIVSRDRRGCLPIHLAAWNGHVGCVDALLSINFDTIDAVDNAKESALHLSAQHGHAKVVSALLQRQANARLRNARSETALDLASRFGRTNAVRLLVTNCPELALQSAVECSERTVVYPVHSAARNGHLETLDVLISSGFDVNFVTDEGTALHVAALFGKVDTVKFLLEKGALPDIRDGHGRTVLEALQLHENEQSSELTQVIQSRDGWSECHRIIEAQMNRLLVSASTKSISPLFNGQMDRTNSRSPTTTSADIYHNVDSDVIWRPIPDSSHAQFLHSNKSNRVKMNNNSIIYTPPSIQAEMVTLDCGDGSIVGDIASTISLSPTHNDNISDRDSASGGLASPLHSSSISRFPITNEKRTLVNNHSTSQDTQCSYQAPFSYDPWSPPSNNYDNLPNTTHPHLAYDNVPSNLLAYDNAPPPGHHRWEHTCVCRSDDEQQQQHVTTDTHIGVSNSDRRRQTSDTSSSVTTANIDPLTALTIELQQLNATSTTPSIGGVEPDASSLSPLYRRSSSRTSNSVTFAAPIEQPPMISPSICINGRAPLATPEEIGASSSSTNTSSHMSTSASPERLTELMLLQELRDDELQSNDDERRSSSTVRCRSSITAVDDCTRTPDESPPNAWSSESQIFDAFILPKTNLRSPNHQRRIIGGHSPQLLSSDYMTSDSINTCTSNRSSISGGGVREDETQVAMLPSSSALVTTDCTGTTAVSSHSSISTNISTGNSTHNNISGAFHRNTSPSPFSSSSIVERQLSADEETGKAIDVVKMRQSQHDDRATAMDDLVLNETAEWQQINDIMESFGAGMHHHRDEPTVAVYLRGRRSHALTLLNNVGGVDNGSSICDKDQQNNDDNCGLPSASMNRLLHWLQSFIDDLPSNRHLLLATAHKLDTNGFDRIDFLPSTLDKRTMTELDIDIDVQRKILVEFSSQFDSQIPSAIDYAYVSDWLLALDLADSLGRFMTAGYGSMAKVTAQRWSRTTLKTIGIDLVGHANRILASLISTRRSNSIKSNASIGPTTPSSDHPGSSDECQQQSSVVWKHSPSTLINDCISYSAHYVGSVEIINVDCTDQCRKAMIKLKKGIREIAKVPHVLLEISVSGVRVLDASTKQLSSEHQINRIQRVCQDERDLNCFAYISQDGDRHFCHVFCVLTADVAAEIIYTLGQAFEVAYCLATNQHLDMANMTSIGVKFSNSTI